MRRLKIENKSSSTKHVFFSAFLILFLKYKTRNKSDARQALCGCHSLQTREHMAKNFLSEYWLTIIAKIYLFWVIWESRSMQMIGLLLGDILDRH